VTINEPVAAGKLDVPVDQFAAFVRELGMKDRKSTSGSRIRSETPVLRGWFASGGMCELE
jgi:hypothetical protein